PAALDAPQDAVAADIATDAPTDAATAAPDIAQAAAQARSPSPPADANPLTAQLATRLPLIEQPRRREEPTMPDLCPEDGGLNTRLWTSDAPLLDQLANYRRALVADHGGIDQKRLEEMVKFYIAIGFGREAEQLLTHADGNSRKHRLLADLARVVEGRAIREDSVMHDMAACRGRIAMWRVAAGLDPVEPDTPQADALIDAFSELPHALRRIAGAEIMRHAVAGGDSESAEALMRILDRTPGDMSASEGFLRARIAVDRGEVDRSRALVAEFVDDRGPNTLKLLLIQAEDILSTKAQVPPELIADLEIEQRLWRGTGTELDVTLALARLDFLAGNAPRGFERLETASRHFPDAETRIGAVGRVGLRSLDLADLTPGTFAALVLENSDVLGRDRDSVALRKQLARGMIAKGLPNAALALVERLPLLPTRENRLLRAEARLESEDAAGALALLDGLDGEDAVRLRADAYVRLGTLSNAYFALTPLTNADPERNRMALLSKNYTDLSVDALPESLQALGDSVAQPDLDPPEELTLATLASQLTEASRFRDAVEAARQPLE
ncbi:MAG: hypothetical protein AAF281_06990, partial [Pseudomonadota bacterium]